MTDFETHPAGTDDLVEHLRGGLVMVSVALRAADRIEQLEAENKRLGDLYDHTCYYHTPDDRAQFHARKIVALEADAEMMFAKGMSHGQQVLKDTGRLVIVDSPELAELREALTRANAATAAAYEVAAKVADDYTKMRERQIAEEKAKAAIHVNVPQVMRWQAGKVQSEAISSQIRALATADQTSALDRLIAEAEARVLEQAAIIANKLLVRTKFGNDTLTEVVYSDFVGAAILAASKKGGV